MPNRTLVVGVGMIPFMKPGTSPPYYEMGAQATRAAIADSGLAYSDIEQAFTAYVLGASTCGQRALYEVGMTGIPIVNVNNNCSSGATALYLARQVVECGAVNCAIAVGFEQMLPGPLGGELSDRPNPLERFTDTLAKLDGPAKVPGAAVLFGPAKLEYIRQHGTPREIFAEVSVKARRHAVNSPYAVFRTPITIEEVLHSAEIYPGLTKLEACPPTCGAAAAIVCSESFAKRRNLNAGVAIRAQSLTSDTGDTFAGGTISDLLGKAMIRRAAQQVYESAGLGPEDIDVIEMHDCFVINEILNYENLGLVEEGGAEKLIRDGDNTFGGRFVINPSGGLLSKGHPLGATGLAQCAELVWQLRGVARGRQVDGARLGLQHNVGLGSACVVTLFERV
jgi:acetyl-CoA acetyltransferase